MKFKILHAATILNDNGRLFIGLGFNDTSTLVGNFVSSPREKKRDRKDSREDEREGQGRMENEKVKKLK